MDSTIKFHEMNPQLVYNILKLYLSIDIIIEYHIINNSEKEKGKFRNLNLYHFLLFIQFPLVLIININMSKRMNDKSASTNLLNKSLFYDILKGKESDNSLVESKENNNISKNDRKMKKRQLNSLEEFTKKFMNYVLESNEQMIDLNMLTKNINLKKRRIYDITNVFEGN